jgi:rubrerythrin
MEPKMREPLLKTQPQARAVSMGELVGIAHALVRQALRRNEQLARSMERRGAPETAAAFRRMLDEEQKHVEAVRQTAAHLREAVPPAETFESRLPPEIAASWDEIAPSALLTPYRAYALAVRNEERAFTLFIYLSAHARDEPVRAAAERLATEALRRASLLRRWRREAYHHNGGHLHMERPAVGSVAELRDFLARREAEIASCHARLAAELRAVGDEESASLLENLAEGVCLCTAVPAGDGATVRRDVDPIHLLSIAQKPLESLSEELQCLLESDNAESAALAEAALTNVLARLARVCSQLERRSGDS